MKPTIRARFWLEAGLASLCGLLAVLTVFRRDWIEATIGVDPDRHSGSLEWATVAGLLVLLVVIAAVARVEWRRSHAAAVPAG